MGKVDRDINEPFEHGKFGDDEGNLFNVKSIYDFAKSNPEKYFHKSFPLSKLEDNLEWWDESYDINNPNDKNRVLKADLSYPLLVIKEKDGGLSVSDGLNRLYKAINIEHLTHLPVYLIGKDEIEHLAINDNEETNLFEMTKKELEEAVKSVKMKGNDPCWKGYEMVGKKMKNGKEVPNCVPKNEEAEVDEQTMSDSSGSYEGPAFGASSTIKKPIGSIHNADLSEGEINEQGIQSSGEYDVPLFGSNPRGGRRDPLQIDGPKSIGKSNAVKNKKFPKFGGPGGIYIKIKEKCKKFPYCNQGDINNIEVLREAIDETSKKYGLPKQEVEKIVLNGIKQIFI